MLEYNTSRNKLVNREYGRNVQKMIESLALIEDPAKRNEAARAVVKTMSLINSSVSGNNNNVAKDNKKQKESIEYWQKLWDHLFIISDYQLDVDSPFEKPVPEVKDDQQVEPVFHRKDKIQIRTYGRHLQKIIDLVSTYPEGDVKHQLTIDIANQMKKLYLMWNGGTVEDNIIIQQLIFISQERLSLPADFKLMTLSEMQVAPSPPLSNKSKKKKKKRKSSSES